MKCMSNNFSMEAEPQRNITANKKTPSQSEPAEKEYSMDDTEPPIFKHPLPITRRSNDDDS